MSVGYCAEAPSARRTRHQTVFDPLRWYWMATLVRIKRKADESPADTIVLASKKQKVESEDGDKENYVFTYAGTFKDPDSKEANETLRNVKHCKTNLRESPKSYKSDVFAKLREQHQRDSREKRLQLLLSHRAILEEIKTDDAEEVEIEPRETTNDLFRVYNVVTEDSGVEEEEEDKDGQSAKEATAITCNDVPLIREPAVPPHADHDYVYDVYYNNSPVTLGEQGDFVVEKYAVSEEFLPEAADESDLGLDDDSDSNAEDNWRNDYPDEDADFEKRLDYYEDYSDDGGADCVTDGVRGIYFEEEDDEKYDPGDDSGNGAGD